MRGSGLYRVISNRCRSFTGWLSLSLLASPSLFGFGTDCNEVVGRVADAFLTEQARDYLRPFLGSKRLEQVAAWAEAPERHQYSEKWHFASIPLSDSAFCPKKHAKDDNLFMALPNFIKVLRHAANSKTEKAEAAKWIINLMADIHQPVNIACLNDSVGKETAVIYRGRRFTLHSLWDEELINQHFKNNRILSDEIIRMTGFEVDSTLFLDLEMPDWINEALEKARYCYKADGKPLQAGIVNQLPDSYASSALVIIKDMLFRASLRLAHLFNNIASGEPTYGLFKYCWDVKAPIFHSCNCPIKNNIQTKNIRYSDLIPGNKRAHGACKLLIQRSK